MPHALDKRVLRVTLNVAEMLELESRARESRQSVNNYVRTTLGLQKRNPSVDTQNRPLMDT